MRVVVVGGGVIGCAIAYELAREGAGVVVLEGGHPGDGASGAAAGHLTALDRAAGGSPSASLAAACIEMTTRLVDRARDDTGLDSTLRHCGTLRVAGSEADVDRLQKLSRQAPSGFDCRWLGPDELTAVEPALAPTGFGALLSPHEGVLDSRQYTNALAAAAARSGAEIRARTRVTGFYAHGGEVSGVRTNNGNVAADHVVLAAGAWTPALAADAGVRVPVAPIRGQMVAVASAAPVVHHTVYAPNGSLTPRPEGTTWIGATVEDAGFRPDVTAEGLERLLANAIAIAPVLARAQFARAWAGLRPMTPDGEPVIGPAPGLPNLTIATGHHRAGIMLAAPTARVVADIVLRRPPAITIEGLGVERFAVSPAPPGGSYARPA